MTPPMRGEVLIESSRRTDDPPRGGRGPSTISLRAQAVLAAAIGLIAVALWTPSAGLDLWLDEVITIAIAERSVPEILELLRLDGAPPLYYLLASAWQEIFGTSEVAARALPLTIGVLAVALGAVAVARRIDARTGWIFGAVAVVTPGVVYYSTEARQYSLLFALGLMSSLLLFDEINTPRLRQRMLLAVVLATACYTHNWGVFLTAGTLVALVVCGERPLRTRITSAAPIAAVVGLLYLPWLAVVLHQASTTGAPWLAAPTDLDIILDHMSRLVGSTTIVLFGIGLVIVGRFAVRERSYDAVLLQCATTVAFAWVFSVLITPAFTHRYLMVGVGPVLFMLAICASRGRKFALSVLVIGLTIAISTSMFIVNRPDDYKSRAAEIAARIDSHRRAGATVAVVAADTSLPALSYYLDEDLDADVHFVSFRGAVDEPRIVDWSDITEVMRTWDVDDSLQPILDDVDVVVYLDELASLKRNRMTEYWEVRRDTMERTAVDLDTEPRLRLTDEWELVEWVGRTYEVVP